MENANVFRRGLQLVAAACLAGTAQGQTLWVVDQAGGPGADFTTIDAAVGTASEGDTLLVRAGSYAMSLDKALNIVADEGQLVSITGSVTDLAPGASVVLRGLHFPSSLTVSNNATPILLEDCALDSGSSVVCNDKPGLLVEDCLSVALIRCELASVPSCHHTPFGEAAGYPALHVIASDVHVFDSRLEGGDGADAVNEVSETAGPGGPGALIESGTLRVQGSVLLGGVGGNATATCSIDFPEAGGAGLLTGSGSPAVFSVDTEFTGGAGGQPGTIFCTARPGPMGPATQVVSGTLETDPGPERTLSANSPVRAGEILRITVGTQAGDFVWMLLSFGQEHTFYPTLRGTILLADPITIVPLGISSGADLELNLDAPVLAGVDLLNVFFQAVVFDTQPEAYAGGASAVALLAPGF